MLLYFFNSTWHTADLKIDNFMPTNNYKLRVWASEPHTMLMHYRSEPKTEYECRFSYYQIRIIWIESSCISEFRCRWSENFVPWHSRSHGARIQVPFINYIKLFFIYLICPICLKSNSVIQFLTFAIHRPDGCATSRN
jgi:hypothetical protein